MVPNLVQTRNTILKEEDPKVLMTLKTSPHQEGTDQEVERRVRTERVINAKS